jgi:hypothetical protein
MVRQSVSGLAGALSIIWSAITGQTNSFVRQNRNPLLLIALYGGAAHSVTRFYDLIRINDRHLSSQIIPLV